MPPVTVPMLFFFLDLLCFEFGQRLSLVGCCRWTFNYAAPCFGEIGSGIHVVQRTQPTVGRFFLFFGTAEGRGRAGSVHTNFSKRLPLLRGSGGPWRFHGTRTTVDRHRMQSAVCVQQTRGSRWVYFWLIYDQF